MRQRPKRTYRKRRRALSEEETRRRITEAAVELHGTVGPAKTTVTDLAKRAGVSRMTVYNHFPTEADLFKACSGHWAAHNPFPDPSTWGEVAEPEERLRSALHELYGWYRLKRGMLENVIRDAAIMPDVSDLMDDFWGGYMGDVTDVLLDGWHPEGTDARELEAMVTLVVDFDTWSALTDQGLDTATAADLATDLVVGAVRLRSN